MVEFLKRENAPDLAYLYHEGSSDLPPVIFLGGFRSDMEGTKALYLEEQCRARQQSYLRFDYSGHGQSGGNFEDHCISDWAEDASAVLKAKIDRPAILVGSSMGGWISLLLAPRHPKHVQALIGLAAAPDFTVWMEEKMTDEQRRALETKGEFLLENDYGDPYVITKHLIDDGRNNLLLDKPIEIEVSVRLIQGKQDADVPWQTAERIKEKIKGQDTKIIYIEDADHRLSSPEQLAILGKTLAEVNELN